ncbi:MAG: UV DNA damage repair endonuclease UvsE [candidate division Zixibacteria bacterium]|nr:UV DNA damage repair endonuclease UvsE [candidate division Zixibacteria bacterium]
MKIGYPCINRSIGCRGDKTFRLKSYSEERLVKTVEENLFCLSEMLKFNLKHNILFFRITSDLVPFASHPICKFNWQEHFKKGFIRIGNFVKVHGIRISMHPDQFTLINSVDRNILKASLRELRYHCQVLDLMSLDASAKIQIHVGGVYGDKDKSIKRFLRRFTRLDKCVTKRLVIENDDRNYSLSDCLLIHQEIGVPVIFDLFHHQLNSSGETVKHSVEKSTRTWRRSDGFPMVDYSCQEAGERKGRHAESINPRHFKKFLEETKPFDYDVMLEIKDKEKSALRAVNAAWGDGRFVRTRQSR